VTSCYKQPQNVGFEWCSTFCELTRMSILFFHSIQNRLISHRYPDKVHTLHSSTFSSCILQITSVFLLLLEIWHNIQKYIPIYCYLHKVIYRGKYRKKFLGERKKIVCFSLHLQFVLIHVYISLSGIVWMQKSGKVLEDKKTEKRKMGFPLFTQSKILILLCPNKQNWNARSHSSFSR
jgi:hypothetical protein